ncbi:MAG: TIGR03086 family metal-binding protein [Acidimicrobiales bacterium]
MSSAGPFDHYSRAVADFGRRVQAVRDDQWELPTPSGDWDVLSVVAHVVLGESQVPPLLAGDGVSAVATTDPGVLGPNPMAAWRGTALAALEAVRAVGDMSLVVHHPLGDLTVETVVAVRVSENLVHGWDVATALGADVTIDEEAAEWCLDLWRPVALDLAGTPHYGEPVEPPPDASAGVRLLALLGREI